MVSLDKSVYEGGTIVSAFLTGLHVLFYISFIIRYAIYQKIRGGVSGFPLYLTVFAGLFYIISIIASGVYFKSNEGIVANILQNTCWNIGNIISYIYLLFRLQKSFKDTDNSLTKGVKTSLIILLIIYLLFIIYSIIIGIWLIHEGQEIYRTDQVFHNAVMGYKIGLTIVDLVISISLLVIFIKKLYRIGENIYKNSMEFGVSDDKNIRNKDGSIRNSKETLFTIMSRVSILSITMIISCQIVLFFGILSWMLNGSRIMDTIYLTFKMIDSFIASVCLFMGFEFTRKWYNLWCGCCHRNVKQLCLKSIDNSMTNKGYNKL